MNYFSSGWGRLPALLNPKGALTPRPVHGNILITAARAGVCVALPLVGLYLAGRMDLAPYAAMGCFTALYARDDTYTRRAWILAVVATGLTLAVALGALTSALGGQGWAPILVVAAVAAGAKYLSDALRLGPPAGLMFVFAAGVAAYSPPTLTALPLQVATTAAAAALCWALALVGALAHPRAPQRLAVARALRAVADHLNEPSPDRRRPAHQAVERAWQLLHAGSRTPTLHTLEVLTARAQVLLPGSGHRVQDARTAAQLSELARRVRLRRLPDALVEGDEHALLTRHADRLRQHTLQERDARTGGADAAGAVWAGRLKGAFTAPPGAGVWALRMALACLAAGAAAWALGLGHGYWAVVSAAAVLQSTTLTSTWHRTLQRAAGTVVGVVVAAALFSVVDVSSALVVIAVVVACQVGAELLVMTNYAYAIVCVTPLTLALSSLAHPGAGTDELAWERLAATVLGAVIGVLAGLIVLNRSAGRHLRRVVERCERACADLEQTCQEHAPASASLRSTEHAQALARYRLGRALADLEEGAVVVGQELAGAVPGQVGPVRERAQALLDQTRPAPPRSLSSARAEQELTGGG